MTELLNAREIEILKVLARGLTQKEAASELGIRPQTLKNHLGSAYRALGVRSNVQAFLALGWLTPPEEAA